MAAWHCRDCGLNYPATWEPETPCPACFGNLTYYTHKSPTPQWQGAVKRKKAGLDITVPDETAPGEIKGNPLPGTSIRVRFDVETDTFWVSNEELAKADYLTSTLKNFDVVELNGKFYELQGYSHGNHEWWIERIVPEDDLAYLDELPTTSGLEGEVIELDNEILFYRVDGG